MNDNPTLEDLNTMYDKLKAEAKLNGRRANKLTQKVYHPSTPGTEFSIGKSNYVVAPDGSYRRVKA